MQSFCGPEITNFDNSLLILQNVLRLQVSMSDTLFVHKSHTLEDLLHENFNGMNINTRLAFFRFLDDFLQIFVAVFKNQILCGFTVLTLRVVDFEHPNHIFTLL